METEKKFAETYGGKFGAILPLVSMIGTIVVLCIAGMSSMRAFWGAALVAIAVAMIMYKDKNQFNKAAMKGFASPSFTMLFPIFIMAGILGQILTASKLVDGLVYVMSMFHVPAAIVPAISFIMCGIMSTVTGSSAAALLGTTPMLLPLGVQMGCPAGLVLGAICSGAEFGNNLAPISDVTITSAIGQDVGIVSTVRTRVWYSLAAAIPALILFLVFGFVMTDSTAAMSMNVDSSSVKNLLFLVIPVLVAVMIFRKASFLLALITGNILGIVLLLILGYTDLATVFAKDGLLASGTSSLVDILIFMALIFVVLALIEETGILDDFKKFMLRHAKTPRMAEIASGLFTCVFCLITGSGMSTIAFVSPVVRKIVEPFNIARTRAANYIAGFASGLSWVVPHGINSMIALGLAIGAGVVGEEFTHLSLLPFNFFNLALIVVYWIAILTGIGRKTEK